MIDGYNATLGIHFTRVTYEEVTAELIVDHRHRQPYGIVHGGVYAGMVETVASVSAGIHAMRDGLAIVGLDNQTSFLHAVRGGVLRASSRPLTRGRRTHLWEVTIVDEAARAVARGQVRLLVLEGEGPLAGEPIALKSVTNG